MSVEVSGCYYHEGKAAVAVCALCGAGICRKCAVKDDAGRTICVSCGNTILKEEHKRHRRMIKQKGGRFTEGKDFIAPGIIGCLLAAAMLIAMAVEGGFHNFLGRGIYGVIGIIFGIFITVYFMLSLTFGFVFINDLFASRITTRENYALLMLFEFMFALVLGWIPFTFYWIRFVVLKIIKKSKK